MANPDVQRMIWDVELTPAQSLGIWMGVALDLVCHLGFFLVNADNQLIVSIRLTEVPGLGHVTHSV